MARPSDISLRTLQLGYELASTAPGSWRPLLGAYGALFYLIYPFDLIPDSIPVIGYLDDFAMLALAAAYYLKKYSNLRES